MGQPRTIKVKGMKTIILTLALLAASTVNAQKTTPTIGIDKYAHFGTFFTASYIFTDIKIQDNNYKTFEYFASTQFTTFALGMAKESIDLTILTGRFSWGDILANQMGALTGTASSLLINRIKEKRSQNSKALKL